MLSFKLGAVPAFGGAVAGKIAASAHRQHQASGAGDVRAGARVSAFHPTSSFAMVILGVGFGGASRHCSR